MVTSPLATRSNTYTTMHACYLCRKPVHHYRGHNKYSQPQKEDGKIIQLNGPHKSHYSSSFSTSPSSPNWLSAYTIAQLIFSSHSDGWLQPSNFTDLKWVCFQSFCRIQCTVVALIKAPLKIITTCTKAYANMNLYASLWPKSPGGAYIRVAP